MSEKYGWWNALVHGGCLIAPARLEQHIEDEPIPWRFKEADRLREGMTRFLNRKEKGTWIETVLEDALGHRLSDWPSATGEDWTVKSITGESLRPRRIFDQEGNPFPLFVSDNERVGIGKGRRDVARAIEWLRKKDLELALITNGKQWRIVYAGETADAWAESSIDNWFAEGRTAPALEALRHLLNPEALRGPLKQAVLDTRKGQSELSAALGERVRQAVEHLIVACGKECDKALESGDVTLGDLYAAGVRMVMRMVVLLFAESRDLLPMTEAAYFRSYSLRNLFETLEREGRGMGGAERLRTVQAAWPRIIALCRLVHNGSPHSRLAVPEYGGELFLPGDPNGKGISRALAAIEDTATCPSDLDVQRILTLITQAPVKIAMGKGKGTVPFPVDFSQIDTEYIGILYEGLLDYELRRVAADQPQIILAIGDQPILPLRRLEGMSDAQLKDLLDKMKVKGASGEGEETDEEEEPEDDDSGEGVSSDQSDQSDPSHETPETPVDLGDRHAVLQAALEWAKKAALAAKIVKRNAPPRELETVARSLIESVRAPGEYYLVRFGGTRKGSGTFYTVPALAGPTVRRTLEPLLHDENGPRHPEEILGLKVCDPACGSGSFPLAALRLINEALYESLIAHGWLKDDDGVIRPLDPPRPTPEWLKDAVGDLPGINEPIGPIGHDERIKARLKRHVVERCLYGVDINRLAVELTRVALWIETMDPRLPFSFLDHKFKVGDAILGCWFDRFQDYPLLAWQREGGDKAHPTSVHHVQGWWTSNIKGSVDQVKLDLNNIVSGNLDLFGHTVNSEGVHTQAVEAYESLHLDPSQPDEQKRIYAQLRNREDFQRLKTAFDGWCAVWFWPAENLPGEVPTASAIAKAISHPLSTNDRVVGRGPGGGVSGNSPSPIPGEKGLGDEGWPSPGSLPSEANPHPGAQTSPTLSLGKREGASGIADQIHALAARHHFFHWELEFPDVFAGDNPGFHAVFGNPPWEIRKPNSKEWFSNLDPLYRSYGKQVALEKQREIFREDESHETRWLEYNADLKSASNWVKSVGDPFGNPETPGGIALSRSRDDNRSLFRMWEAKRKLRRGHAPLPHPFISQGSADINTYKLFLEQSLSIAKTDGRIGLIVPSGVYTDRGSVDLRDRFLNENQLEWLFGFENRDGIFNIHRSFKFCPVIVQKGGETERVRTAFMRRDLADWERTDLPLSANDRVAGRGLGGGVTPNQPERTLFITREQIRRFSPRSRALLEVRDARDIEILETMTANGVPLGEEGEDGWGVKYAREFDMTNDSKLFPPREQWERQGYRADEYGHWLRGNWREMHVAARGMDPVSLSGGQATAVVTDFLPPLEEGWVWSRERTHAIRLDEIDDVALPLYQGLCLWQFNAANADYLGGSNAHAKWTKREEIGTELPDTQYLMRLVVAANAQEGSVLPRLGYRAVQNATNVRTWICTLLPGCPAGNSIGTATTGSLNRDIQLLASLTSFVADQALRPRMSQANLNWFVVEEVPVLPPLKSAILAPLAALLSYPLRAQSADLVAFADATGSDIAPNRIARTIHERLRLRSMLDAAVAHLYGLSQSQFAYILRDCDHPAEQVTNKAFARNLDPKGFWRVDKNLDPELRHPVLAQVAFADLKNLIRTHGEEEGLRRFLGTSELPLSANDRVAGRGLGGGVNEPGPIRTSSEPHPNPPRSTVPSSTVPTEGWLLPETLCLADYNLGHDDRAKHPQPVAPRLGPRFYDWQLKQTPEESWAECRHHANKIRAIRSIGLPEPEPHGTGSTEGGIPHATHGTGSTAPTRSVNKPATGNLFDEEEPQILD